MSLSQKVRERFVAEFPKASQPALDRLCAIIEEEYAKCTKERKRSGIDERASAILNVYPRREGGEAALLSISKAIQKDGFDCVLERTAEYGQAVARWAPNRRKAQSGASLIPLPTTWFNQRRYMDDSSAWWEGTGGKQKTSPEASIAPPDGWLQWLETELSLLTDAHPAHSQLLYAFNSRAFSGMPASWQTKCRTHFLSYHLTELPRQDHQTTKFRNA